MGFGTASIFDLRDIWTMALKRKWLIIIPAILVFVLTAAGSFLITPEFESFAIIAVSQQVRLSTDLQRMLGIEPSYRRNNQRRDELRGYYNELTSTAYLSQLVNRLQLTAAPGLDERARKMSGLSGGPHLEEVKAEIVMGDLKDKLQIRFAAQNQLQITAQSFSATRSQKIANELADIFITEKLKQELTSIRTSQDFSDLQLQKYEHQLNLKRDERTQVQRELLQIQLDESIASENNRADIATEIEQANTEISDFEKEEKAMLARVKMLSSLSNNQLKLEETSSHLQLKEELRELFRAHADRMTKYVWSDPQTLNFKLRQNNTLASLKQENRKQVADQFADNTSESTASLIDLFNLRSDLDFLYSKASYLQAALDELNAKIALVPDFQARLNRLDEEIVTATDLRDRFKQQQESSSISQALLQDASSAKYRIVEPARRALEPFKPDRKTIALMGLVLGLMLGVGAAIVVELMDNSIKRVEEVEELLGLPVLGIAPNVEFMKKIGV